MPQLLLEFFSEEIPARMQARAEADLERLLMDRLTAAGFLPEAVKAFAGPRRLAAVVEGLPARQPDVREEKKGPRVGAPEAAIQGFLKSAGLAAISEAEIIEDKKGAFYVARVERRGRETPDLIAEMVPEILRGFPWPKSMRSQDQDFRWVRPLKRVLCAFDGEAVALPPAFAEEFASSGRLTEGHRFHAPGPIEARRFEDYEEKLRRAFVIVKREERKARILADARTLCAARNLQLVEDPGLLEEVAGLVEWPQVLMGEMDPAFLQLPGEVIRLTMRTHQKYFAVRDAETGRLAPCFIVVANIAASDGGAAIRAGNARVLSARLNDARFFWDGDLKRPLDDAIRAAKLKQLVFHQKLGSVWEKVERVAALACEIAPACGADPDLAERAARLAKMDLVTETVGEFPELQGQIGRQLWEQTGDDPRLAAAIEDHYRPLGPNDRVPSDPIAAAVAIADKADTIDAFFDIGEAPTGSSDPYALRRAGLGLIRTILTNNVRLPLKTLFGNALQIRNKQNEQRRLQSLEARPAHGDYVDAFKTDSASIYFLADRLKVQLREQGKRHDLVDAVFVLGDDDLVRVVARIEALSDFLKTEDGANLLAGSKRAANILKAEEKKEPALVEALSRAKLAERLLQEEAEIVLARALDEVEPAARAAVAEERFADAMGALSRLRAPVDRFFEAVLVNADDKEVRLNRLLLLSRIREALKAVADFAKIEG